VLNATSISALLVTSEAGVTEIKEDKPSAPAMPNPGDMY
jgi:chaperonin GroEL